MQYTTDFKDPHSILRFPWKAFMALGLLVGGVFTILGGYLLYNNLVQLESWIFLGLGLLVMLIFGGAGVYGLRKKQAIEDALAQGRTLEDIAKNGL